jgi:predicted  nucleic acid-binding Zn-ribbon protein
VTALSDIEMVQELRREIAELQQKLAAQEIQIAELERVDEAQIAELRRQYDHLMQEATVAIARLSGGDKPN